MNFDASATIVTAIVAVILFYRQKSDERTKAARVVLMEIRHAENKINQLKSIGAFANPSPLLIGNSWANYAHLFTKLLNRDEIDILYKFYQSSKLIDTQINTIINLQDKARETTTIAMQNKLVELADKYKDDPNSFTNPHSDYSRHKEQLTKIIHDETYWFLPNLPKERLVALLSDIPAIATSAIGLKLKKVEKME
jgi:hypothetical protein